jgi:hypothetical protein
MVAVYLAQCVALKAHSDRQAALRSQWPMIALMVCHTMTSLRMIAQPMVTTRRSAKARQGILDSS